MPALGGRIRMLIASDGDLARLPFEVLPTSNGERLIDDYQTCYLSCGRDVLRFGPAASGQLGKPLVMSLWKVPDEPTRELMEAFYTRLLAGQGRAEALREAQLAMKAKYPDPFYWGAFICQGDPGPMAVTGCGSHSD